MAVARAQMQLRSEEVFVCGNSRTRLRWRLSLLSTRPLQLDRDLELSSVTGICPDLRLLSSGETPSSNRYDSCNTTGTLSPGFNRGRPLVLTTTFPHSPEAGKPPIWRG